MALPPSLWRRFTGWLTGRWVKIKTPLLVILLIVVLVGLYLLIEAGYAYPWTGFGEYTPPQPKIEGYQRDKTTWDWLQLLIIPIVLAVGGFFLNRTERINAEKAAEKRAKTEREIAEERARDAALQAYLDQMTELLLHEKLPLRTSQPDNEVRSVARARTLAVLRVLDGVRKATVLQFLYEAKLIGAIKQEEGRVSETIDAIVILDGANLGGAYLERAHLDGANLGGAYLGGANLELAKLFGANLVRAHLNEANLYGAKLFGANLKGADLYGANLKGAYLESAHLGGAHLDGAHLDRATLSVAHLDEATLVGATLVGATLFGATLVGATLQVAHLNRATLSAANLKGANLKGAHLGGAHLDGAHLDGADLTNCKVTREQLAQAASIEGATLPFDMTSPLAPEVEVSASQDGQPQPPAPEVAPQITQPQQKADHHADTEYE